MLGVRLFSIDGRLTLVPIAQSLYTVTYLFTEGGTLKIEPKGEG